MIVFVTPLMLLGGLGLYFIFEKLFPFIDQELTELTQTKKFPFNILLGVLAVIGTLIWSFNY